MISPLEKARKDPDSMKAKILKVARRVFGEYGFHGTTTRLIAQETGIDISTLHYHWGSKKDLYESVIVDINKDLRQELVELADRLQAELAEHDLEKRDGEVARFRRKIGDKGWFGLNWPREYGGMGLSASKQIIMIEEFERHGCARTNDRSRTSRWSSLRRVIRRATWS